METELVSCRWCIRNIRYASTSLTFCLLRFTLYLSWMSKNCRHSVSRKMISSKPIVWACTAPFAPALWRTMWMGRRWGRLFAPSVVRFTISSVGNRVVGSALFWDVSMIRIMSMAKILVRPWRLTTVIYSSHRLTAGGPVAVRDGSRTSKGVRWRNYAVPAYCNVYGNGYLTRLGLSDGWWGLTPLKIGIRGHVSGVTANPFFINGGAPRRVWSPQRMGRRWTWMNADRFRQIRNCRVK